jgi:hypothetical protein
LSIMVIDYRTTWQNRFVIGVPSKHAEKDSVYLKGSGYNPKQEPTA